MRLEPLDQLAAWVQRRIHKLEVIREREVEPIMNVDQVLQLTLAPRAAKAPALVPLERIIVAKVEDADAVHRPPERGRQRKLVHSVNASRSRDMARRYQIVEVRPPLGEYPFPRRTARRPELK